MVDHERLCEIVEALIDVMQLQAKALEQLVLQVEQIAGRLPQENQFSPIVSELSELKRSIRGGGTNP